MLQRFRYCIPPVVKRAQNCGYVLLSGIERYPSVYPLRQCRSKGTLILLPAHSHLKNADALFSCTSYHIISPVFVLFYHCFKVETKRTSPLIVFTEHHYKKNHTKEQRVYLNSIVLTFALNSHQKYKRIAGYAISACSLLFLTILNSLFDPIHLNDGSFLPD